MSIRLFQQETELEIIQFCFKAKPRFGGFVFGWRQITKAPSQGLFHFAIFRQQILYVSLTKAPVKGLSFCATAGALVSGFIYLRLFSQDRMAPKPSMPIISSHRLSSMTDAGTFTSGIV